MLNVCYTLLAILCIIAVCVFVSTCFHKDAFLICIYVLSCMLQADEIVNIAIEKINGLLELFIGISDSELGMQFCEILCLPS